MPSPADISRTTTSDNALLKDVQNEFEKKLLENEIAIMEYWQERLERLIVLKPDGIASLQLEMRKLSDMMSNRITTLKRQSR